MDTAGLRAELGRRERELVALSAEIVRLRREIALLDHRKIAAEEGVLAMPALRLAAEEKIALFRKRFAGREDTFAVRWKARRPENPAIRLCASTNGSARFAESHR